MRLRSCRLVVVSCLGAAMLAGCNDVDVQSVRDFAKSTVEARATLQDLAADYAGTCLRDREYAARSTADLRDDPLPGAASPAAAAAPSGFAASPDCADAVARSREWSARNDIVIDYVRSLGAIAGVTGKPEGVTELAASLHDAGVLPKAPFDDLATGIVQSLFARRERDLIGRFVTRADVPLHGAVASLKRMATDYYSKLLDAERNDLNGMYRRTIRAETEMSDAGARRLDIFAQRIEWARRRDGIDARQAAVVRYRDALDVIVEANDRLKAAGSRAPQLAEVCRALYMRFSDDVVAVAKAVR
ncbi:MAG: hypothetical protein ABR591_04590 [Candidatus Velthaea sp.]